MYEVNKTDCLLDSGDLSVILRALDQFDIDRGINSVVQCLNVVAKICIALQDLYPHIRIKRDT